MRWKSPREGLIKINVDGVISDEECVHGMGVVARDSLGEVMAAMVCKGQDLVPIEIAKACSLLQALSSTLSLRSSLGAVLLDCKKVDVFVPFLPCPTCTMRR
ncbi:hypothetical protein SLA2020_009990 [Shorea laevis]